MSAPYSLFRHSKILDISIHPSILPTHHQKTSKRFEVTTTYHHHYSVRHEVVKNRTVNNYATLQQLLLCHAILYIIHKVLRENSALWGGVAVNCDRLFIFLEVWKSGMRGLGDWDWDWSGSWCGLGSLAAGWCLDRY